MSLCIISGLPIILQLCLLLMHTLSEDIPNIDILYCYTISQLPRVKEATQSWNVPWSFTIAKREENKSTSGWLISRASVYDKLLYSRLHWQQVHLYINGICLYYIVLQYSQFFSLWGCHLYCTCIVCFFK